jgi:hypothetical protein
MGGRWSSTLGRSLAGIGAGVLSRWITPELADEVTGGCLAAGGRPCGVRFRALPARLGVYFVVGLCLFSDEPYRAVLKELSAGLAGALGAAGWRVPASTALTRLRRRLGERPFELLFWQLASAMSPGRESWSHICGLLAVAWDGTTVKAAASAANTAAFGGPHGPRGGHYPQIRLVTLIACGTRALLGAAPGPYRDGERKLAVALLSRLGAGMLLIADRGFYSYRLWRAAAGTGADLLWRVPAGMHLPVVRALPDGSWLTVVADPAAVNARAHNNARRRRRGTVNPQPDRPLPAITVRAVEFTVTVAAADGTARAERYRLITTVQDWQAAPAAELAAGYAWRWAIETGFREFKTYQRGPGRILRGRTPELARQEIWAYLAAYQAIRAVMALAAASAGLNPDQISFTATLHAIRRTLITARASPDAALAETEADILTELLPQRAGRVCVRAVTQPFSAYPSRRLAKEPVSQHATWTVTIHHPGHRPRTSTEQEKHRGNHRTRPP